MMPSGNMTLLSWEDTGARGQTSRAGGEPDQQRTETEQRQPRQKGSTDTQGRFRLFVSDKGDSSVPVQRQRWHPSETGVLVNTIIEKLTGMEVANRQAAGRLMIRNLLDIEERLRPFADEMEEKMESTGDSSAGLLRAQRETSGLMRALTTQLGLHPVADIADHMRWHRVHSVVTHPDLQQWLPKTVETPERDLKPEISEKDVVTVLKKLNRVLGQLHDVCVRGVGAGDVHRPAPRHRARRQRLAALRPA